MKVAVVNLGISDYTAALAEALAERVEVTLVAPESQVSPWLPVLGDNVRIISCAMPRMRDPRALRAAWIMLDRAISSQPGLLHLQDPVHPWFDIAAAIRTLPPLVVTVHDAVRHRGENGTEWLTGRLRNVLLRRARAVIVHTASQKTLLCESWNIPEERIHVVPHGELGTLYERASQDQAFVPREPETVLFFGRIMRYKGMDVLLAAMNLVQKTKPAAKLIIAGRGDNIARYLPAGASFPRMELIDGFIPHTDVAALFRRATVAVLPYLEASQSGVANLAMGLGTPVIASSVGGLSELIQDGQDGILVPPGDPEALARAILRLMQDEDQRTRLASAALVRCKTDLSWDSIALKTIDLYRRVLQGP